MSDVTLQQVLEALGEATPGPWAWVERSGRIEIAAPHGGGTTVMDFVRLGMQRAQPRFGVSLDGEPRGKRGGVMVTASELIEREGGLQHPDAQALLLAVNWLRANAERLRDYETLLAERDALRKDAERYRRLRTCALKVAFNGWIEYSPGYDDSDADMMDDFIDNRLIDAATSAEPLPERQGEEE